MTLIQTIPPEQAEGRLADLYREIAGVFGYVPNAFRLYSASPDLLETQWRQTLYFIRHPRLSFPLLACTRMLVSQANQCDYCVDLNAAFLIERAGFTPEQVAATRRDPAQAPLPDADRALLLFTLKTTATPEAVSGSDLDALRALGWSDADILDATTHAVRNQAVDKIFNSFKIERDA